MLATGVPLSVTPLSVKTPPSAWATISLISLPAMLTTPPLSQMPPPPVAPSLRPLVTVQPLSMIVRMLLLVAPPREALFSASVALSNVRVLVAANALVDAAAEIGAVAGDRTCVQRQPGAVAFVPTVDANSTQGASHRRIDGPGATAAAVIED